MSIDNLTFGELKQIAALFQNQVSAPAPQPQTLNRFVGMKCIIRTNSAGVWFGEIAEKAGAEVLVKNARRMWRWWAAESISLSGVAQYGIKHDKSKIAPAVANVWLEAIELIECTDAAVTSIEKAKDAVAE